LPTSMRGVAAKLTGGATRFVIPDTTKKGACSRKLPSKMESKMPYTIICLNLHVQVGSLSLVFVLRSRRSNSRKLKSGTLL